MNTCETTATIKLLHLSDLHFGLNQQDWMWPTFRTQFFEDLRNLHERSGPWDLVIFSGDLTQRGSVAEFDKLTEQLSALWTHFKTLGSNPKLIVVPGNHDLARPSDLDPIGRVMTQWWSDAMVRDDFFKSADSVYRVAVTGWFHNYVDWCERLAKVVPMVSTTQGLLPGDFSTTVEKGGLRLGVVGLNSAWLQHAGGDFFERLCVHPRQLMAVTAHDPDGWCAKHDFRLLVTHHPVDWLHRESQKDWAAEITPPGRFDAHLFGHMHEGRSTSVAISGSASRHSIQAASLFGLESYGTSQVRRDHGYLAIQIPPVPGSRGLRIWPRKLISRDDGSKKMGANQNWELIDDNYADLIIGSGAVVIPKSDAAEPDPLEASSDIRDILARLVRPGMFSEAHAVVRKSEQTFFLGVLKERRQAWLVTDWGLGGDEFIQCVQQQMLGRRGNIYFLDLHGYRTKEAVLQGLPEQIGCSFPRLFKGLADEGKAILVLDDLELYPSINNGADGSFLLEIEALVQTILDFCPELSVVVRSRVAPASTSMRTVELGPLDEADTALYVSAHQRGSEYLATHDSILRLHRHTDGIPSRIDSTLKDLQIVGLQELFELDSDVAGKQVESRDASPALVRTIQDLANSKDETNLRSYELLKVLSMFPQGEQLVRVKRFFGSRGFYPNHASRLIELALVDAVSVNTLRSENTLYDQGRALMVRRPVREYVVQSLSESEHRTLSSKALALYFGGDWELKGIKTPSDLTFKDSRCEAREIVNACTMMLRATRAATDSGNLTEIRSVLALVMSFAAQLRAGDHFRSIVNMYDDVLPLHERAATDLDLDPARVQYAQALRMIGEHSRSAALLRKCESTVKTKELKQRVLSSLALISEKAGDNPAETLDLARRCVQVDPKTKLALQAQGIILANDDAFDADRDNRLRLLQEEARKRKAYILLSNLALKRAEDTTNPERKKSLLQEASKVAREKNDAYNLVRASILIAQVELNETGALTAQQMLDCTRAYEYLYNQRLDFLFRKCHEVLWQSFSATGDNDNLLNLFRHSSLVWRLRGHVDIERDYVARLLKRLGKDASDGMLSADRKLLYFITRSIQLASDIATLPGDKAEPLAF